MTEVLITVYFDNPHRFSAGDLTHFCDELERLVYLSDEDEVRTFAERLDLSDVQRDAALWRLRNHRNQRLVLDSSKSGSVILSFAVMGVVYFVLNKMIGETISDAFKETDLRKELVRYLSKTIDRKMERLAELARNSKFFKRVEVGGKQIFLTAVPKPDNLKMPPTLGSLLDEDESSDRDERR